MYSYDIGPVEWRYQIPEFWDGLLRTLGLSSPVRGELVWLRVVE
jgi:hypothetical protein